MLRKNTIACALGLSLFAAALATGSAQAQAQFTIKFGTATANDDQHQFILFFKEEIEKSSGGKITVQAFPASQLGPIPRQIEGLQLGTVEAFLGPADFFCWA